MEELYSTSPYSIAEFKLNAALLMDDENFQTIAVKRSDASVFYVVNASLYETVQKQMKLMKE